MSVYATGAFWAATLERAVKTAAQSFVGTIGVTAVLSEINWEVVGGVTAVGALLSIGTSIASAKVGGDGPSLGAEVVVEKE